MPDLFNNIKPHEFIEHKSMFYQYIKNHEAELLEKGCLGFDVDEINWKHLYRKSKSFLFELGSKLFLDLIVSDLLEKLNCRATFFVPLTCIKRPLYCPPEKIITSRTLYTPASFCLLDKSKFSSWGSRKNFSLVDIEMIVPLPETLSIYKEKDVFCVYGQTLHLTYINFEDKLYDRFFVVAYGWDEKKEIDDLIE